MGMLKIFELAKAARLAGVEMPKAKNWTNGRVLLIRASIREAEKKGARNLFNEKDVLKLYLAQGMTLLGFTPKRAIEEVLRKFDELFEREGFEGIMSHPWLIIRNTKNSWKASLRKKREFSLTLPLENKGLILALDLSAISRKIQEVDKKASVKKEKSKPRVPKGKGTKKRS
jgi:hypothetical protein